ncbi:MAG: hypothetical protein HYR96_06380 [Deltaproteobacteria bacterium]|nr:hypothetical protein [Deltaproteobacteria bacterium]MBI3295852.1 hypothetical protein [Deltaproteobacteria bacterium]
MKMFLIGLALASLLFPACSTSLPSEVELNNMAQSRTNAAATPAPVPSVVPPAPLLSHVDLELATPVHTIEVSQLGDDIYSAVLPIGLDNKDYYVTGIKIFGVDTDTNQPTNTLHHAVVFQIPPTGMTKPKEPSYQGGIMGFYVMGSPILQPPSGYGLKLNGKTTLAFTIHFNQAMFMDTSMAPKHVSVHIQFQFASTVNHLAYYIAGAKAQWKLQPDSMLIPANTITTRSETLDPFRGLPTNSKSLDLLSVLYHMHNRGIAGQTSTIEKNSSYVVNADDQFSYANQYFHNLPAPAPLTRNKTQINFQCTWNNTQPYQPFVYGVQMPVVDVFWGESTVDEMCYHVLLVGEKGSAGIRKYMMK